MQRQPESLKAFNLEAATRYFQSLSESPAEAFLVDRGLNPDYDEVSEFGLGYVEDPMPGHEAYRGMLSIPYFRPTHDGSTFVCTLRFRCLEHHNHEHHGKYNTLPGDPGRMFNTPALVAPVDVVAICEGELDAVAAKLAGVEAVGVPGAQSWKPEYVDPFRGYETVFVLTDGDDAGRKFGTTVAATLPNAKVIPMPPGEDVNSLVHGQGVQALLERLR